MLFQEGFDHYGLGSVGRLNMLNGPWAEIDNTCTPVTPSFAARTGSCCMAIGNGGAAKMRRVLAAPETTVFVTQALYVQSLPSVNESAAILQYLTSGNTVLFTVFLQANGALSFNTGFSATSLAVTPANTIRAGTWQQLEIRCVFNADAGQFEIKVDTVQVVNASGLTTTGPCGMLSWNMRITNTMDFFYIDDLAANNASGTLNNTFLGSLRVATLYMKADDTPTNWTARTRRLFGNGVLQTTGTTQDAITCADSADFEFGTGDFTLEGFFRFTSAPAGSTQANLFSKWREDTNERSYRLFLGGPALNGGKLEFQSSTNGQAGTVTSIVSSTFAPIFGRWHHICVQRASGITSLFVDGALVAAPVADATNYNDNTSLISFGGQQNGATGVLANSTVDGFMDELRVTKSVARYGSGFTVPVAAFPRSVIAGDTQFANVSFLAGFDSSLLDESGTPKAITARGNAARFAVDDAQPGKYKTVNQVTPRDDTFVEAPFTAATGTLTFTGQPINNETVTSDGKTYTFKNPFVDAANNVAIGGTVDATINNLTNAINAGAGVGVAYGTGTTASVNTSATNIGSSQLRVTANVLGTGGNAIVTTETVGNAAWGSGTLTGGLSIPGPQAFTFDRLPALTTGVRAMSIVRRSRKSDTGPGSIQSAFVHADTSTANGANNAQTTSFTNYEDVIETDPSTGLGLTPTTFLGGRIRVDRTA